MVDTQDLGSCAERRVGSSPTFRTVISGAYALVDHPLPDLGRPFVGEAGPVGEDQFVEICGHLGGGGVHFAFTHS